MWPISEIHEMLRGYEERVKERPNGAVLGGHVGKSFLVDELLERREELEKEQRNSESNGWNQ